MQRTFTAYGEKLRRVNRFKYLGRVLSYDDSDTPAVRRNLQRARTAWGRLSVVIAKEEVPLPWRRCSTKRSSLPFSSTAASPRSSSP